jgi:hypothetical protein
MQPLRTPSLLLCLVLAAAAGCAGLEDGEGAFTTGASIELVPDSASVGVPRNVEIWGQGTDWQPGEVAVDFGQGVDVPVLIVDSSFHLTAQVIVAEGAQPGSRDVLLTWPRGEVLVHNGFVVEQGSIAVSPNRAALGETLQVEVTGWQTDFRVNHTVISFGPSVDVLEANVLSSSRLRATVHVPLQSEPGPADLTVYNPGGQVYTLASGFMVDRDARRMTIEPAEADQGEELTVVIEAEDANFEQGWTEVVLGTGVVTVLVTVLGPETLEAQLRIGNNAATGTRDVLVRTDTPQSPEETRLLADGFSIYPVQADPLRARVSLSLGISRAHDAEDCDFSVNVYASATFYEPNDFPCPPSGASSSMMPPPHFDIASTGHTMTNGSTDCPSSKTFDAGPWVEYVSEAGTVTLDRYVHPYNGRVSYRGVGLDLQDYLTDTVFDLHTPGGDLGWSELPPWQIPTVLTTLPVDYQQHGPDYCGLQHPLDEPLSIEWDPAGTYDESEMYLYMLGPAQDEGVPLMMVYPWDDGEFTYSPGMLSFFTPGFASLIQSAYRQTRFDVPGSDYTNAGIGTSNLIWRGAFELRE